MLTEEIEYLSYPFRHFVFEPKIVRRKKKLRNDLKKQMDEATRSRELANWWKEIKSFFLFFLS